MLKIARIYGSDPQPNTYRILVDRIWPRGISKAKAQLDWWPKEIAPSTDLRKWFKHDEAKYTAFKEKYRAELAANEATSEFIDRVRQQLQKGDVVLLYGAKDTKDNQAQVLRDFLQEKLGDQIVNK